MPSPTMSAEAGIVFREADRAAMDHAAAFALEFFGEISLAAAVTAQIGQVHAGLLAVALTTGATIAGRRAPSRCGACS